MLDCKKEYIKGREEKGQWDGVKDMKAAPYFLPIALLLSEQLRQSWREEVSLLLHPSLALDSGCFEL